MTDVPTAEILAEVIRAQEGGPPVLLATLIVGPDGANIGARLIVREDGSTLGSLDVDALDQAIVAEAADVLRPRGVRTVYFDDAGTVITRGEAGPGAFQVMTEVYERPARLVIAGGGHVGKALSTIAAMCGFRVTIVDDRPEYADPDRFPEADEVIRGRFDEVLAGYPIDGSTYVVAVTRGHRHDEISLRAVVGRGAAYVGMIGSKRRAKAVLQHLVEDGANRAAVDSIHTPIGLDIGAETPEEIAVAIMGEIIQVRRRATRAKVTTKHPFEPGERGH
jgi:xanthine dehydrogenase accessory factor